MPFSAGFRLGAYEILSPLGAGGMGEVYRAKDPRLNREVAIKVLPEGFLESEEGKARFAREATTLASLSHPNIAVLHSFEEIPGSSPSSSRHILVMELLEGATLREKVDAGPIPPKQTVDYALQIAKGLSAAHEKGIVHRDLKPENLIVSKDGHVKILDFGLAKRTDEAKPGEETSAPTESKHTEPGVVMGTLGYMSPEQVRGLPVDHRSDIFSFGAILYEMLSGKKAFKRDTAADTMSAIMRDEPPELSESGRNVSPALDQVVKHCLEKDRSDRFQSAKDIAFALSQASGPAAMTSGAQLAAPAAGKAKAIVAAAALVLFTFIGVFLFLRSNKHAARETGPKRIAVLPFENLGAPEDAYFTDGIADEIRGKLTSLPGVEVIARASSTTYRKTTKTPNQIGQELGVRYLLTATVRWDKGTGTSHVHVSPELVEVRDSAAPAARWQQPFDAALTDVFRVQSEIASGVAHALGLALGASEEKRLLEKPTQNLAAYDAFLKGEDARTAQSRGSPGPKPLVFYEQAVALDPEFALAWAYISFANVNLYYDDPRPEFAERGRQAAEKAAAIAPELPEPLLALARYAVVVRHDFTRARELYARAERLAPGNANVYDELGGFEAGRGRFELAAEYQSKAERLDPREPRYKAYLAFYLLFLRRYPEAREACDRGLAVDPAHLVLLNWKILALVGEGDLAGARAAVKTESKQIDPTVLVARVASAFSLVWVLDEPQRELLLRLTPSAFDDDRRDWAMCLAQAYALRGDAANVHTYAEEARKAYEEKLRAAPEDASSHAGLGLALAYLGRKDEAVREGERAAALVPVTKDPIDGPQVQHPLATIYILVGEEEKALDQIEQLLKIPYLLSPAWLRIDPTFDPLRKNPRFQKLVTGK